MAITARKLIEIFIVLALLLMMAGVCRASDYYLQFDGTGYVDTGQTFATVFPTSFSVNIWAKPDAGAIAALGSVSFWGLQTPTSIWLGLDANGNILFEFDDSYSTIPVTFNPDGRVHPWTMLTVTAEKTGGNEEYLDFSVKIYTQSTLIYENTGTVAVPLVVSNHLGIGGQISGEGVAGGYFPGMLDDFRIYAKVLSQAEITAIYNNGRGTKYPDGVATASFALNVDEGTGTTVTDAVSGTLQGTLNGGVTWVEGGILGGTESQRLRDRYDNNYRGRYL